MSGRQSHGGVWLHSWWRWRVGKLGRVRTQVHKPDGKVLELKGPLKIETLSPVTELLPESASQTMHLKQHIPEMDNFYIHSCLLLTCLGVRWCFRHCFQQLWQPVPTSPISWVWGIFSWRLVLVTGGRIRWLGLGQFQRLERWRWLLLDTGVGGWGNFACGTL